MLYYRTNLLRINIGLYNCKVRKDDVYPKWPSKSHDTSKRWKQQYNHNTHKSSRKYLLNIVAAVWYNTVSFIYAYFLED